MSILLLGLISFIFAFKAQVFVASISFKCLVFVMSLAGQYEHWVYNVMNVLNVGSAMNFFLLDRFLHNMQWVLMGNNIGFRLIAEKLGIDRISKTKIVGDDEVKQSFYGQLVFGKGVSSSLDEQLAKEVSKAGKKLCFYLFSAHYMIEGESS